MLDYATLSADVTVRPRAGEVTLHGRDASEDWSVDVVDTGPTSNTGGRIKRLRDWVGDGTFMLTWGDGVSDIDLDSLLGFHRSQGKIATLTSVRPPARVGPLVTDRLGVVGVHEEP